MSTSSSPRRTVKWFAVAVVLAALVAVAVLGKGRGYKYRLMAMFRPTPKVLVRPQVLKTQPRDGSTGVAVDVQIKAQIKLGGGTIVPASANPDTVLLLRARDQSRVEAKVTAPGGGNFLIVPAAPLEPNTDYCVLVTEQVRDAVGAALKFSELSFSTAGGADPAIRFEKVPQPAASSVGFTCVQFGPDQRLWAAADDGRIFRFDVAADGNLAPPKVFASLQSANGGPTLLSGFCFDPSSTPQRPILWASHTYFGFNDCPDWTGKISRLSGEELREVQNVITGLPRSRRDHITNQPVFGPDGALYFNQGASNAYGDPDPDWQRPEHLLTASVLRVDVAKIAPGQTVNVLTRDGGGTYDPYAPGAPLTIYATGLRVAYDMLWASDGKLYAPTNGSAAGGHAPAVKAVGPNGISSPAIPAITTNEDDWLNCIVPGGYYGHPNPQQGHFVLNGGNPTRGYDYGELVFYPVGLQPDPKWVRPIHDFGKHVSPNGIIEYKGKAFDGKLDGWLMVCRYNIGADIVALHRGPDGSIDQSFGNITGLTNLTNPLDITQDPRSGAIYVAEYGGQRITLFRPARSDFATVAP